MDQTPALALWNEAKTLRMRYADDTVFLFTRQRWIGEIHGGVLSPYRAEHEECDVVCRIWLGLYAAEHLHAGFSSEAAFVLHVMAVLKAEGWACQREVITTYGRIDLMAERDGLRWILEAKRTMMAHDVTRALGQLLAAREVYPDASLAIVTPVEVPDRWRQMFARYQIAVVGGPWTLVHA